MRRLAILTVCSLAAAAAFAQGPPANAPSAPKKVVKTGPGPKTQAEQQAVQALLQAQMPDDKRFRRAVREHVEFGARVAQQNSWATTDEEFERAKSLVVETICGGLEPRSLVESRA